MNPRNSIENLGPLFLYNIHPWKGMHVNLQEGALNISKKLLGGKL